MKERQIICPFLLPADQEATRAVDPGMRAFDDPAARSIARSEVLFLLFSTSTADVRHVLTVFYLLEDHWIIVACIQTHVLRLRFGRIGTGDDDAVQGGTEKFHIMAVGSVDDDGQGNSSPVSQEATFDTEFAAISGIGSGRGATERGFRHCPIH